MATESETPKRASPWHPVTSGEDASVPPSPLARASSSIPELEERAAPLFDTHGLTPEKPPIPRGEDHVGVPTPIEADAADLVPAVTMPDAAETFPTAPVTAEVSIVAAPAVAAPIAAAPPAEPPATATATSPYLAPYTPVAGVRRGSGDSGVGNVTDADAAPAPAATVHARPLPPSAIALLSVGEISALDDAGEAFVPRFDPAPTDSAVLPESPLAHATIEDSRDPAYTPEVAAPPSAATPVVELSADEADPTDDDTTPSNPEDTMADATLDEAATDDAAAADPAMADAPEPTTDADAGDDGVPLFPSAGGDGDDSRSSGSFWTSTAFLVIVGLLVMTGVGLAIYALFFKPAAVELPAETVVVAPAEPTLTPIAVTDASEFLAAMPTTVGAYALTAYTSEVAPEEVSATTESTVPEGVAEQVELTYSDGTNEVTVYAWQHFGIDGAQQTFETLNVDGTDAQPVIVGGEEVGVQVNVESDAGPTVLWLNGTAVFSAISSGDDVQEFVAGFGF